MAAQQYEGRLLYNHAQNPPPPAPQFPGVYEILQPGIVGQPVVNCFRYVQSPQDVPDVRRGGWTPLDDQNLPYLTARIANVSQVMFVMQRYSSQGPDAQDMPRYNAASAVIAARLHHTLRIGQAQAEAPSCALPGLTLEVCISARNRSACDPMDAYFSTRTFDSWSWMVTIMLKLNARFGGLPTAQRPELLFVSRGFSSISMAPRDAWDAWIARFGREWIGKVKVIFQVPIQWPAPLPGPAQWANVIPWIHDQVLAFKWVPVHLAWLLDVGYLVDIITVLSADTV